MLTIWIWLLGFWIRYFPVAPGDDSSTYAMNYAHAKGMVFGRDVAFTYGPLAYLIIPMHVGGNLAAGILFQVILWLCFAAVTGWLILGRRLPLGRVLCFGICLFLASGLFREFGYAGPDMFVVLTGLLLLGASIGSTRALWWLAGACAAAVLVFFIKASSALVLGGALGLFAVALSRRNRRYLYCLATIPPAVLLVQVIFFGSLPALWGYICVAQEMSAGYGAAMSAGDDTKGLWTALALIAAWIVLTAVLRWRKADSWPLALAGLGPLFFEFKHSFVREAGHIEIFFLFIPLLCGWLVLFTEFRRKDIWYLSGVLALVAALWYPREVGRVFALRNPLAHALSRDTYSAILDFSRLPGWMDSATATMMSRQRLPPEMLSRIGGAVMAGFPMECGYPAVNPVEMRPFPIFQWYMANTPFLDGSNAAFLEDAGYAPAFLVFHWDFVDDRHPLLDSPAALQALSRHYELDRMYGDLMLLRRRARPRFGDWRLVETRQLRLAEPLRLPAGDHPLAARIHLAWNTQGRLLKFLFRVPEVRLVASTAAGRTLDARIPSEVMEDGVPNFLPFDLEAMRAFFAGEPLPDRVDTILIGGPGARYLQPSAPVEIYEAPDTTLPFVAPRAPDFESLRQHGELSSAWIEVLNDTGASAFSMVTVPNKRGYLRVQGWAAIQGAPAGAVFVELDGKPHPAEYGKPRADVQALLHSPDALRTGFEWAIPASDLGRSWHELGLKIVTKDGAGYYDGARKLRFRME